MKDAAQLRRPFWVPAFASLTTAIVVFLSVQQIFESKIMMGWFNDRPYPAPLTQLLAYLWMKAQEDGYRLGFHGWLLHPISSFEHVALTVTALLDEFDLRQRLAYVLTTLFTCSFISFVVTLATARWLSKPMDRRKHISGRRLIAGASARRFFKRAEQQAIKSTGRGIELCPGMTMSRQREARHTMLTGATGSGKTVIFLRLLRQILVRRDRVIAHDVKGDLTQKLPDPFILLAPQDDRSAIWDIAADVTSAQDAREFVAAFIPPSHDPVWAAGAREIVTGAIVALQKAKGRDWGWEHLRDHLFSKIPTLRRVLQTTYPQAAEYLELDPNGQPSKLAVSFMVTARAHLAGTLLPIAEAWSSSETRTKFSVKQWLRDEQTTNRTVILQRAANFPELSSAWISAFISAAANYAVSPALPEDDHRRIWFCLDEFPQIGKVEKFQQILELGRSRGICAILGLQDPHQLQHLYGADVAKTWQSTVGTKIICRMEASASADLIRNELIGKRIVSWTSKSKSMAPLKLDGSGEGTTRSRQTHHEELDVVSSAFLETELGWFGHWPAPSIRALIVGSGRGEAQGVLQAEWPIENWPILRPAAQPADWTK